MKPHFPIQQIRTLDLEFDTNASAYSNNYSDIYFQPGIGLAEKRHVFLAGNNLPENWQEKQQFVIAETGFGTGLNFLMTWQAWQKHRGNCQRLDFVSCELHPMNTAQLTQALDSFTELKPLTQQLIAKYPEELIYGIHRLEFKQENISLTLLFGDATKAYQQLSLSVDAWYLDGFGPSKNPEMWQDDLFQAVANNSKINTTAATFTVARAVRDGLQKTGFEISKSKGFGQKREMLKACFKDLDKKTADKQPWFATFQPSKKKHITIIGAGTAGLSLASKLTEKGESVNLIDRHQKPCSETSGNPQAMVMPMFTLNDSKEACFYLRAFLYACQFYDSDYFHQNGVLQLALSDKQSHWQQRFLKQFDLPETIIQAHKEGLLYPNSGWLDTQGFAEQQAKLIQNYIHAEVESIEFINHQWHLFCKDKQILKTDVLILANGIHSLKLLGDYELPLTAKHGQISYFNSDDDLSLIQNSKILLNKGYITPSWQGQQTLGATFDHVDKSQWYESPISYDNHWQRNIDLWKDSSIYQNISALKPTKTRAGIRVTTPDHLPVCGSVIDQKQFKSDYADLHHGKQWINYPKPKPVENLYLFTGLGSRGYTSTPILAEFLSNLILNTPSILEKSMQQSINPNRFLFKSLKSSKPK